jgi:uncharacterized protein (DUF302 family)
MEYNFSKIVDGKFKDVILKVTTALKDEGFGIITEINLKEKFKEKLSIDFRNYTILGACNPKAAYEAIQEEDKIGVMLPCNVLVQEHEDGKIEVAAINPLTSLGAVENERISHIATKVSAGLERVIFNL